MRERARMREERRGGEEKGGSVGKGGERREAGFPFQPSLISHLNTMSVPSST